MKFEEIQSTAGDSAEVKKESTLGAPEVAVEKNVVNQSDVAPTVEEIKAIKETRQAEVDANLERVRTSLGLPTGQEAKREIKKAPNFEEGFKVVLSEVEERLKTKAVLLLSVAGKSGSGKTVFAQELGKRMLESGKKVTVVSSDDFYKKHESIEEKELDIEKLQDTIKKLQNGEAVGQYQPGEVIIVEGLQTIEDKVLGQKPDYRTFVETDFGQRMGRRLIRDAQNGFRTVEESMDLISKVAVNNPEIIAKFEGEMDKSGVNLEVTNAFKSEDNPELFISGTELIYSVSGKETRRKLEAHEVGALKKIGVKEKE